MPQRSCLGPLLFTFYLNDFETNGTNETEVLLSLNELGNVMQNFQAELEKISECMRINYLSIKPEKTEFMVIDYPRRLSKLPELPPFYLDST